MNAPLIGNFTITQRFGEHPEAYSQYGLKGHNGIDYACPESTPVYACSDGAVVKIGSDASGYGTYLKIHYPKYKCSVIYAHLLCRLVYNGARVEAGGIIARTGNTGNSTGPHLHYEVRPDGEPLTNGYNGAVDPLTYEPESEPAGPQSGDVLHVPARYVVNLRTGPGTEHQILGSMLGGCPIEVVQVRGDWVLGTLRAWVHKDYLE